MRVLLDMCIPAAVSTGLAQLHDIVHVRDLDPRATDRWIVDWARDHERTVVTLDLDFGDIMSHIQTVSPSVVLLRLRHPTPDNLLGRITSALTDYREALESGAIVIVEDNRDRVRRLPIGVNR